MKKTLFLAVSLGLSCAAAYAADPVEVNPYIPQSVIKVQEGDSMQLSDIVIAGSSEYQTRTAEAGTSTTVEEVLQQNQIYNESYAKRSAIVKDGAGTLTVAGTQENRVELNMSNVLLVREGTLSITDATITNTPLGKGGQSGNNLSVGGIGAHLVLTRATYTTGSPAGDSLVTSSISIGSLDGDALVELHEGSTLRTRQTINLGGSSSWTPAADPKWETRPHKGGSYASVSADPSDAAANNTWYNAETDYAGFENKTTPAGTTVHSSTATVVVDGGSQLESGSGFYVYNAALTISGHGSQLTSGAINNSDNVFIGSKDVFGENSKAVVKIENGGKWLATNGQYAVVSYYAGENSEITVSGTDEYGNASAMSVDSLCFLGGANVTSRSHITIADGGQMSFKEEIRARGSEAASHTITVTGENSALSASDFYLYGATKLIVSDAGLAQAKTLEGIRDDISVVVKDGGQLKLEGDMVLKNGAQLDVANHDSAVSAKSVGVSDGAEISIGRGAKLTAADGITVSTASELENNGIISGPITVNRATLKGSGTMGATSVQNGGKLIVGNSPGKQTYTGNLSVDGAVVEFSVDDLLNIQAADSEHYGWGSGCHSVIDMGGNMLELENMLGTWAGINIQLSEDAYYGFVEAETQPDYFEIHLVTNIGNADALRGDTQLMADLHDKLFLEITGGLFPDYVPFDSSLYSNSSFEVMGNDLVWVYGTAPEPTTAALSLLALAGLAARRRRH